VDTTERHDARNAATGSHDDLAADLLAENPIRRADVTCAFRGHRRGFEAVSVLTYRSGGLVHDSVLGRAAAVEREIESNEVQLDADHVRSERP
jgi:hypothetical protein